MAILPHFSDFFFKAGTILQVEITMVSRAVVEIRITIWREKKNGEKGRRLQGNDCLTELKKWI